MELVVKSNSFGVMEFTVKKPQYVRMPSTIVPGNVYNVQSGVAPPLPPVIEYPTTPVEQVPNDSPSTTE